MIFLLQCVGMYVKFVSYFVQEIGIEQVTWKILSVTFSEVCRRNDWPNRILKLYWKWNKLQYIVEKQDKLNWDNNANIRVNTNCALTKDNTISDTSEIKKYYLHFYCQKAFSDTRILWIMCNLIYWFSINWFRDFLPIFIT